MKKPDFSDAFRSALSEDDQEWDNSYLHASDIGKLEPGEGCARQIKYRLEGAEKKDLTVGEELRFDHGHRIHERVVELLSDSLPTQGWDIAGEEVSVSDRLPDNLTGRLDFDLVGPEGQHVVCDTKTARGRLFDYVEEPRLSHKRQLQVYMWAEDADYGIVLYVDREGSNAPQSFIVERDDERVNELLSKLKTIQDIDELPNILDPSLRRRENKGPDSLYIEQPWQCEYCPYKAITCDGALPDELTDLGIVAKQDDTGQIDWQLDDNDLIDRLKPILTKLLAEEDTHEDE
jgi:hypothetical protein